MKLFQLVTGLTLFAILPFCAAAAPLCPTAAFSTVENPSGNAAYINAGGGCNEVITFSPGGSVTITIVNPNPYDGLDDTLIGVVNNSSSVINNFVLSNTITDLFGFDGDGICAPEWNISPCNFGTFGYEGGVGVSFSGMNAGRTSGTVNFAGGLPPGGQSFFSLEGSPTTPSTIVPEPRAVLLAAWGLGAATLLMRRRKHS